MIIFANGKLKGTTPNGDISDIGTVGPDYDQVKTNDVDNYILLTAMLKELKIMNLHMMQITDTHITNEDIDI